MSVITTSTIEAALRPGIHDWWGLGYKLREGEFSQIFEQLSSSLNYERDQQIYGLGYARVKPEGAPYEYDTMGQGFHYDYIHVPYVNAFVLSHEQQLFNQYQKIAQDGIRELGSSMKQTKEVVHANILNRAFNNSYVYGDGVELCSTAHVLAAGGTYANKPAVDADLSEEMLEQALIDIGKYTNDRGMKRAVMARKLVIPVDLEYEACRILNSDLRVATANNDINAIKSTSAFPEGYMVYHYLTDTDAWFILTDCPKGPRTFQAEAPMIKSDVDFTNDNILYKTREMYSCGVTDVMSVYGSQGA